MRFLHLADLHLGKRVNGFDMLEDQRFILEQVLALCQEHGVEAVVLAGDIYDAPVPPAAMGLDERGGQALALVRERGAAGPTDLVQAFGSSAATWSRALSSLAAQGAVIKRGQKYQPTEFGRSLGGTL